MHSRLLHLITFANCAMIALRAFEVSIIGLLHVPRAGGDECGNSRRAGPIVREGSRGQLGDKKVITPSGRARLPGLIRLYGRPCSTPRVLAERARARAHRSIV